MSEELIIDGLTIIGGMVLLTIALGLAEICVNLIVSIVDSIKKMVSE